jgi:hypothetical protein
MIPSSILVVFLFSGFQSNDVVQIHIAQYDSIITIILILSCRYWVASKLPLPSSSIDWKRYGAESKPYLRRNTDLRGTRRPMRWLVVIESYKNYQKGLLCVSADRR